MKCARLLSLAAALVLALGCAQAVGQSVAARSRTVTGPVTGVSDGDTFYMLVDGRSTRMRLAQIDAPEKAQPFGRKAEQSLRELIGRREVTAIWTEIDRFGRLVAEVEVDGVSVNAEQVRRGFAWAWPRYVSDPRLFDLQARARTERRGMWIEPAPVEPWSWRRIDESRVNGRGG